MGGSTLLCARLWDLKAALLAEGGIGVHQLLLACRRAGIAARRRRLVMEAELTDPCLFSSSRSSSSSASDTPALGVSGSYNGAHSDVSSPSASSSIMLTRLPNQDASALAAISKMAVHGNGSESMSSFVESSVSGVTFLLDD